MSEKAFEALFAGAIPVYRGSPQISQYMPSPDSFIDANNLSPTELGDLMIHISNDESGELKCSVVVV